MSFYALDEMASTQAEYTKILDDMDELVDKFINKLNFYSIKSDQIVITNINQEPFIKTLNAYLTGYLLSFQLLQTDQFNYCGLDC